MRFNCPYNHRYITHNWNHHKKILMKNKFLKIMENNSQKLYKMANIVLYII